jgi:glutamate dehydrogenase
MEGIHLRFGKVARGGLRWSDRREDFRTEVLGLVKAQQVKNAVIVPVGSKGGFVVKRPPAGGDREAFQNEGIACYKTLIFGMLDITDNLKGTKVVPPADVVRRDDDDPYLVVAADKGTATFSDIANQVSADYGFWLGDAFASGGSHGYDHKKMGITARGVWESVKRHFREMGADTQAEDFTVVGVGDMSGDVFGNGMLLSPHITLVAAFNHMHIFVDPDPNPAKSFAERKRLFALPRSGWSDYDRKRLSRGGAVFERRAKSLKLSSSIKKRFGISKDKATPNELIRALLGAEVDLLWFGGIGTYVKATHESNAEVGDRANDAIRINAASLRCRVIGEGANLGVTQRARVEYALAGGRLNTDSIDNSGGVDCSDHEVNIKILLDSAVAKGEVSEKQRNALLARMTDEVAELVLTHNYLQTQAMSLVQAKGVDVLDDQVRLMRMLERTGRLDRAVEFLPDDETLEERAQNKLGLTRPEIAVLMSYSKIWLYDEILDSGLPDDAQLAEDLVTYFPRPVQDKLKTRIARHRLRREIIATRVTNSMINRVGGTFVTEFMEKTGMAAPDIARAYTISRQVFAFRELWEAIASLDTKVPAAAQTAMTLDINHLIEWTTLWFLRHGERRLDIGGHVSKYKEGIATLAACLDEVLPSHYLDDLRTRGRPYLDQDVPEELALRIAGLVNLFSGCDIVRLARRRKLPVPHVAKLYFAVGTRFRLGRLRAASEGLESETHWQKLAVAALIEEIYGHQLALTNQVLDFSDGATAPAQAIDAWVDKNHAAVERTEQLLSELRSIAVTDISMVAVASRQLRALADSRRHS